jgi:hypothetical protein
MRQEACSPSQQPLKTTSGELYSCDNCCAPENPAAMQLVLSHLSNRTPHTAASATCLTAATANMILWGGLSQPSYQGCFFAVFACHMNCCAVTQQQPRQGLYNMSRSNIFCQRIFCWPSVICNAVLCHSCSWDVVSSHNSAVGCWEHTLCCQVLTTSLAAL